MNAYGMPPQLAIGPTKFGPPPVEYALAALPSQFSHLDAVAWLAGETGPAKRAMQRIVLNGEVLEFKQLTQQAEASIDLSGVANALDYIRESMGLSVTQLAELFGVTRKSIYDWYEGSAPRSNKLLRIEVLRDLLSSASEKSYDLKKLKGVWSIETGGHSFRSLFSDDTLGIPALRSALVEKLNELTYRMAPTPARLGRGAAVLSSATLADVERSADA